MSIGWQKVRIGDVASLIVRPEMPSAGTTYRQIGVRLWGQGAYERVSIDGSQTRYTTLSRVESGDIIINKIWARNGSVAVVTNELAGCYGSGEFPTFSPDRKILDPLWFHWVTKTKWFWQACDEKSQGTSGKNRIRPEKFLDIEIPLPPLDEQQRIVTRIEALMERVSEAQKLRQEAMYEAYAITYSILYSVFYTLTYPQMYIGELCDTTSGGTPNRSRIDFFMGGIPWVKSGELEDSYIYQAEEHITEEAVASSSAKIFPKGTLVIALYGATVGKTGILEIHAATNQAVCALFPKDQVYRDYLWWFLRSKRPDFLRSSFGGAQPNISQKVIRETEIPVPPIAEQHRIVTYLNGLQAQVDVLRQFQSETQNELNALIPSILDRAFRGEL